MIMLMEPAIKIKNLSVKVAGKIEVINDMNLELPRGKTIAVIGPSGAGKTTLIRSIVGRINISSGEIKVFDQYAGSSELRKQLTYMTQGLSVYSDMTINENLNFFATMAGKHKRQASKEISDILKTVELTDKKDVLVNNLSGGQKQRVSLAVALLGSPKLMVLDEPTVGLDPLLRDKLWSLFNNLAAQGTTLIITSHSMDEAERCDDLVLIRNGEVLAHSSPEELKKKTNTQTIEQSFIKIVGGKE